MTFLHNPGTRLFSVAYDRDTDGHLWCGPTAIAALTGRPLAEIRGPVKDTVGRDLALEPKRGGMTVGHVETVLRLLGMKAEPMPIARRSKTISVPRGRYGSWDQLNPRAERKVGPTLTAVAKATGCDDRPLLVVVTGHFVAMHRGFYIDTGSREARPVAGSPMARRRVRMARWVTEAS